MRGSLGADVAGMRKTHAVIFCLSLMGHLQVTEIHVDPSISEVTANTVDKESVTETKTPAIPDESTHVSVTDTPPTTTTQDETVSEPSETATLLQETISTSIVPSNVETSQTTTSLESQSTEKVTQSAVVTDLPNIVEPHETLEETKQEEIPANSPEKEVPVPEPLLEKPEGNQSALPEQPNGLHDTITTEAQVEEVPDVSGADKLPEEKAVEEGLTFNEWTQKILAEAEKDKQDAHIDSGSKLVPPSKQRKKKNFGSTECGAKMLAHNPEADNSKSVLNSNKDDYMRNPCKVNKKWFVIELCEPIQAQSLDIASLELFSSRPKSFKVFLSDRFPTKDWKFAGEFETQDERIIQTFQISEANDYFAKFVRVELLDHYGSEHFCPITLFRVYGNPDFEEEPHDEDDNGDDDPDESDEGTADGEQDSTNLFTSAKDTVINIVKKVLMVGPDDTDIPNVTDKNATVGMEVPELSSPDNDVEMLPCLPRATSTDEGSDHTVTVAPETTKITMPVTPEPGKTDDVVTVTLLDDDDQPETGTLPLDMLLEDRGKMSKNSCFLSRPKRGLSKQRTSKMCYFFYLVYGKYMVDLGIKSLVLPRPLIPANPEVAVSDVASSSNTESAEVAENQSKESDVSVPKRLDSSSDQSTSVSGDEIKPSPEDSIKTPVEQSTESSVDIKPTTVRELIQQTDSPTFAEKLTDTQTGSTVRDSSSEAQSHLVDYVIIDPSFTPSTDQGEATPTTSGEATPSIPKDWKPKTEDMETHTSVDSESSTRDQTQNDKMKPEPPSASDDKIPSEVSKDTPTVAMAPTDVPQPPEADPQELSTAVPIVGSHDGPGLATEEADKADTTPQLDKQEDKQTTTLVTPKDEGTVKEKKGLDLVKVPQISVNKRESAIMRLSNRMKAMEQNVSLSSRFLEELSKRYKKQSEDMMKMLNKTLSRLTNVTVESEVKHKLHEVEMSEMERRLKNLTDVVNNLSLSLNSLNQEVKDRQMIWTSIEILFIIILFAFVNQRRRKDDLPTDVRKLLDKMPVAPKSGRHQRRNSLSGPSTPSKTKADFIGGSPLQRFSSETALDQEFTIISPLKPFGFQVHDGVKKKKKKKQKQPDFRLPSVVPRSGGKEFKIHPVVSPHMRPGENVETSETSSNSSNSARSSFSSIFPFSFGKPVSDTGQGQQIAAKPKVYPSDGKHHPMSNTSAISKNLPKVVGGETSGNKKGVGGEFNKKPPIATDKSNRAVLKTAKSQDATGSDKPGPRNSPNTSRKCDGTWVKGHRRQRSLPKQHYSLPETREEVISHVKTGPVYFENGGSQFNGIEELPVKASGLKKSTSMPTSSCGKRPPIVSRRSMESIGRTVTVESGAEPKSHLYDTEKGPIHRSGKYQPNKNTDQKLSVANGNGVHSNGWDPSNMNDEGGEKRYGKLKALQNRGRALSVDDGHSLSKSGSTAVSYGKANGIGGVEKGANGSSPVGACSEYFDGATMDCDSKGLYERDESGEKQSKGWKQMFGLFH